MEVIQQTPNLMTNNYMKMKSKLGQRNEHSNVRSKSSDAAINGNNFVRSRGISSISEQQLFEEEKSPIRGSVQFPHRHVHSQNNEEVKDSVNVPGPGVRLLRRTACTVPLLRSIEQNSNKSSSRGQRNINTHGDKNRSELRTTIRFSNFSPRQSPLNMSTDNGIKINNNNTRYLTLRPISTAPSSSPLAHYGNDQSNLFKETVFRTPISSASPQTNAGSLRMSHSNPAMSRYGIRLLPSATTICSGFSHSSLNNEQSDSDSATRSIGASMNGRKSALRKPNSAKSSKDRNSSARLRVSFAKSCEVQPTSNCQIIHRSKTTVPEIPKNSTPSVGNTRSSSMKGVSDNDNAGSGAVVYPGSFHKGFLEIIPKGKGMATARNGSARSTSDGTGIASVGINIQNTRETVIAKPAQSRTDRQSIPTLRHNTDTLNQRTHPTVELGKRDNANVLTADQLIVRRSVTKVQRWIETLPSHFNTIHHILSPAQQDY